MEDIQIEENEDKTTCDCTCKYNNDNVIYL